ncbi:MAG: glycosyl hydrolase family 18 protein [Clostridia bacterium]|nr:glycosyl hydrolase family 18 protein [Clostridia bacterium]
MDNVKKIALAIILLVVIIVVVFGISKILPRYYNPYAENNILEKVSLVVGIKDETDRLVDDIIVKNNRILFSYANLNRFIDAYIQKDEKYNQIITNSKTSVAIIDLENKKIRSLLSNSWEDIYIETKDGITYFDIKELTNIYNINVKYVKETNLVKISKDIHTYKVGNISEKTDLKYLPSFISATIGSLDAKSSVYIVKDDKDYFQVLDSMGRFGYIKQNEVNNIKTVNNYKSSFVYDEKISMLWDYMYSISPDRSTEKKIDAVNIISPTWIDLLNDECDLYDKTDSTYLEWAKKQGYDVWPMIANNSKIELTHTIMSDSQLREKLVSNIVNICKKYSFNGINVDFENMYKEDVDLYSQFIRELTVALHEINVFVSVDVTVPDGSDTWSLCFDRQAIGDAADYVVLMAYDQTSGSSNKPGSNSAKNWIEKNIKKVTEFVDNKKLVIALPFYTRAWKDTGYNVTSSVVNMNSIDMYVKVYFSKNHTKTWLQDEGQYLYEDIINGITMSLWSEDLKSYEEKIKLIKQYEVAGLAFWEADREDSNVWNIINQYLM